MPKIIYDEKEDFLVQHCVPANDFVQDPSIFTSIKFGQCIEIARRTFFASSLFPRSSISRTAGKAGSIDSDFSSLQQEMPSN